MKWFFLRGLVRETGHWSGFLEKFAAAFPGVEVVGLDLPGNGQRFREASPVSISVMREKVRAEFLARKGANNYLFALSLGAMVGLEWMHKHPDFQGAVLLNTSLRGLCPLHERLRPANYGKILRAMRSKDIAARERMILEMTSVSADRFASLVPAWTKIQEERPVSTRNALRQLLAALRFRPPQNKPSAPLLLLASAQDGLVNPRCSQRIAAHWQVPLQVHPTAGHDLTLDAGDWVVEQVRRVFF